MEHKLIQNLWKKYEQNTYTFFFFRNLGMSDLCPQERLTLHYILIYKK